MAKTIYVVKTHEITPGFEERASRLCQSVGAENVFFVYDDTNAPYPENGLSNIVANVVRVGEGKYVEGPGVMLINEAEAKELNVHHTDHKLCYDTAWVALKRMLSFEPDVWWCFENDVECPGDWKTTFEKADGIAADLLVDRLDMDWPQWAWERIYGEWGNVEPVNAFCACVRMSKVFMDVMDDELGVLSGFVEIYLRTLAKKYGLVVDELPKEMLGEFCWSNAVLPGEPVDKLYHAIKV
jgi:hypothetical protein